MFRTIDRVFDELNAGAQCVIAHAIGDFCLETDTNPIEERECVLEALKMLLEDWRKTADAFRAHCLYETTERL